MKLVVQQVDYAGVIINNKLYNAINRGLLIFIGIHKKDTLENIQYLIKKILKLRIFTDENNKMNLSVIDLNLSIMLISQFTLYANCTKGNRPSFINAGDPIYAQKIYNEFVNYIHNKTTKVQTGQFGANMQVSLVNDGPATFILDTNEK